MNDILRRRYAQLSERIDQMPLRERGLLFLSVMATFYFLANSLVLTPISKNQQTQEQALSVRRDQVQQLEKQIQHALNAGKNDVDTEQELRLKTLRRQLAQHDPARDGANRNLVPPAEMLELVEQILLRNRSLQVLHIENLPPELLKASPGGATPAVAGTSGIFRHGMQIELRGRYVDIVNYLHELEALPWKMYWGRFTLTAEDYPNSRMSLVIYTLSPRSGWIGT